MPAVIGLPGYTYAAPLVIDHTKVGSGGVSDFQLLPPMNLPDALAAKIAHEDCRDLRFTLADGTLLYHELVSASRSAQTLQTWVRVPSVLSSSDTTIWGQVGNAAATMPSAAEQQATWEGYAALWHLNNVADIADSTGNGNFGTPNACGSEDGLIGPATVFNGSTSWINCGTGESLNIAMPLSISAWVKPFDATEQGYLFDRCGGTRWGYGLHWQLTPDSLMLASGNGTLFTNTHSRAHFTDAGTWVYVSLDIDATGAVTFGRNGASAGTATVSIAPQTVSREAYIGRRAGGTEAVIMFRGSMQHLGVAAVARPISQRYTEFNNQSAPAAFSTWGPLETLSSYIPHRRNIIYRSGPTLRGVIS